MPTAIAAALVERDDLAGWYSIRTSSLAASSEAMVASARSIHACKMQVTGLAGELKGVPSCGLCPVSVAGHPQHAAQIPVDARNTTDRSPMLWYSARAR